jgi:hypothetical protein
LTANNANNLNGQPASFYTNATNITTGTLATARLPATANLTAGLNVGANVNLSTTQINVGNSTVNVTINSTSISVSSDPLVQQSDIGTDPNQIPLNQYLGALAYQSDSIAIANTLTVGNAAVFVANGNIGLGNTSPIHKLRIEGDVSLSGGVHANGSLGTTGQVLHSNGSSIYWDTDDQGVTSVATGNGLTGGVITSTGTISILANNGVIANTNGLFVNNGTGIVVNSGGVHVNSSYIATLTANNATNLNGQPATFYTNASNITTGTLATARLPATANITTAVNVGANVNLSTTQIKVGNSTVNTSLSAGAITINGTNINTAITSNADSAYANAVADAAALYQTTAGLAANVVTLTSNNSTNLNGQPATFYTNATNITTGTLATARLPATANITTAVNVGANVAITTSIIRIGNTTVNTSLSAGAITINGVNVNTAIASNADSAYANAVANAAALYQTTAGLAANVALLSANNATNLNGQPATFYTNATNITTGTLATARLPATANITTALNIGANIGANTTAIRVGNSTVNSVISSGAITINGVNVNTAIASNADSAYANAVANAAALYQTTAGLAANVVTLTSNNSTNLNGQPASFYTNATNITTGTLATARLPATANLTAGLNVGANVAITTSIIRVGNTTVNTSLSAGAITINGVNVNTAIASNASAAYANAVANAAALYQTTAGLAANVALLSANNATNLNGQPATFYTNASNITTGTLATARLPATANIATALNIGANVNLSTTQIKVGNSTVNVVINSTSISVSSDPLVQQSDIGTDPNQIPLNQYLGSLAYQSDFVAVANVFNIGNIAVFSSNGNLGVGTSSPNTKLTVSGTATVTDVITTNTATFGNSLFVTSNGNVGVGTPTPSSPLHVIGDIRTSSINNGPLAGFRNAIINGNFGIWQRGTSVTGIASAQFVADRWQSFRVGTTANVSRQAFTLGQVDVPGNPIYFHRVVTTSSTDNSNFFLIRQAIESVRTFAGQPVVLTFWGKAAANRNIAVEFSQFFGSGGGSTEATAIGVTTCALTTVWQKFTVPVTIPSISGKTLGSDNNDSLSVNFWLDAGSNFNTRTSSLGQTSGTYDIAQVQLETGSVATPFERRPIGTELALCQRYYQIGFAGFKENATAGPIRFGGPFLQSMRTAPTITKNGEGTIGAIDSNGWTAVLGVGDTLSTTTATAEF